MAKTMNERDKEQEKTYRSRQYQHLDLQHDSLCVKSPFRVYNLRACTLSIDFAPAHAYS